MNGPKSSARRADVAGRTSRRCLLLLLIVTGCPHNNKQPEGRKDAPAPARRGVVQFQPAGRTLRVQVEIVSSPRDRARGLMFRKQLAPMSGMLFLFDRQEDQSFWMKNTYIPLDMIFIDESRKVVGIVENAEPLRTDSYKVGAPSRYVVEVNAGFCKRHGIAIGTPVRWSETSRGN